MYDKTDDVFQLAHNSLGVLQGEGQVLALLQQQPSLTDTLIQSKALRLADVRLARCHVGVCSNSPSTDACTYSQGSLRLARLEVGSAYACKEGFVQTHSLQHCQMY